MDEDSQERVAGLLSKVALSRAPSPNAWLVSAAVTISHGSNVRQRERASEESLESAKGHTSGSEACLQIPILNSSATPKHKYLLLNNLDICLTD
jgi:hypothetical protein